MPDSDVGLGCTVGYGTIGAADAEPGVYTSITDLIDLELPVRKLSSPKNKVTTHSATSQHKYIPGKLSDYDDAKVTVLRESVQWNLMDDAVGVRKWFKFSDDKLNIVKFIGWVSEVKAVLPMDEAASLEITIAVGEQYSFTPHA